jgi:hypothetical protein
MQGDVRYGQRRYAAARNVLAVSENDLRSRLLRAFCDEAVHAVPEQGGPHAPIGDGLADRMTRFHHRMAGGGSDELSVATGIEVMDDQQVRASAAELCDIASALDEAFWTDVPRRSAYWEGVQQ